MSDSASDRDVRERRDDDARAVLASSIGAYAEALAEVVGGLFVAAGVDSEIGARALEAVAARVRSGQASLDVSDDEPWVQIADALTMWWRDPEYLDDAGRPRALPDRGPSPSMESLLTRTVDAPLRDRARELFRRRTAVERNGIWHCELDRNALPVGGMEGAHRLRMNIAGLARTYVDSQTRPADPPQKKNFDMAAHVSAFPESAVPELRAKLYKRLQVVLEDTDFWMTTTADQNTRGPVLQVGVAAFMFTSTPRPRASEVSVAVADTDDGAREPGGSAPTSR
jgi:hypothetical protein